MPTQGQGTANVLPQEHSTAGFLPYNDWYERGYLHGLDHGRFHQDPTVAEAIQNTAATDDIRFRGEHLTVHTISDGTTYAVLWEEWFGTDASTWVRHRSEPAARAWTHAVAAHWLREYIGSLPSGGGLLATWGATTWGVERDLTAGRWNVVVGLEPGPWTSFLSTEDPVQGWAFITDNLATANIHPAQWPKAMRHARTKETAAAVPTDTMNEPLHSPRRDLRLPWWRAAMAWLRNTLRVTKPRED
ncbi:hypothetical protein ACWD4T_00755 [Streptomyces umbrinus]